MTEHRFDKFFRDQLQQHSSQVPEDMWQKITAEQQRRRRALFFRWGTIGSFFLVAMLAVFYLVANKDAARNYTDHVNDSKAAHSNAGVAPQRDLHGIDSVDLINGENSSAGVHTTDTAASSFLAKSNVWKQNVAIQNSTAFYLNKTRRKKQNDAGGNKQVKGLMNDTIAVTQLSPGKTSDAFKEGNYQNVSDGVVKEKNPVAQRIVSRDANSDSLPLPDIEPTDEQEVPMWLDVFVTPEIPFTRITSIDPAYPGFRKDAAHLQLSYGVEARLNIPFSKRITGKIGLRYAQLNEKFSDITLNTTYSNHYKSIELPLLLGYQFKQKDLIFSVNAGVSVNITSTYAGTVITPSYQPVNIGASTVYKRNTGLSLVTGIAVYKPINDKWLLYAEPNLRYKLSNMTGSFQAFEQRMHTAGLSLGMRYNFSKPAQ